MPETMKALVKPRPGAGVELQDVPVPRPGPDELLLKVRAASICGSDIHIHNWNTWAASRIKTPIVFGHEFAGEVVEVGPQVRGFRRGDRVSAESHIYCGVCYQCRTGYAHICSRLEILGVDRSGGFAEYAVIPERVAWKNPPERPWEICSLLEPMGNSVYATLVEEVAGQSVVVTGCGPTGLFAIGIAKACGAGPVIAVEKLAYRREMAQRMGADLVLDSDGSDTGEKIREATASRGGADVVLEMSGHPLAIRRGFEVVRKGGRFTAFGLPSDKITLDLANDVIFKGIRIYGINGREVFRTWYRLAGLLESGHFDPRPVITHTIALRDYKQAFDSLTAPERKCGKVILVP